MSLRVTRVLLGLSLLLNVFVLAGFFFHSWLEPSPPPRGRWGGNPLESLAQDLKLDDAQRKAVQPLIDEYGNIRRERWRDIGKIREAMSAELQKPAADWPKIDGLIDQMMVLRAEQQKQNLRAVEQMATKLAPEKQVELRRMLAERYGGQGRWRDGRPGGSRPQPPSQ